MVSLQTDDTVKQGWIFQIREGRTPVEDDVVEVPVEKEHINKK